MKNNMMKRSWTAPRILVLVLICATLQSMHAAAEPGLGDRIDLERWRILAEPQDAQDDGRGPLSTGTRFIMSLVFAGAFFRYVDITRNCADDDTVCNAWNLIASAGAFFSSIWCIYEFSIQGLNVAGIVMDDARQREVDAALARAQQRRDEQRRDDRMNAARQHEIDAVLVQVQQRRDDHIEDDGLDL